MKIKKIFTALFLFTICFSAHSFQADISKQGLLSPAADTSKINLTAAADSIFKIGIWYYNEGKYNKALPYLLNAESIAGTAEAKELLPEIYKTLANTLEGLHNYKGAYIYYKTYNNIKDSIDKLSKINQQQNLNTSYEKLISENATELANIKNKLIATEIENQNQLRIYFLIGTFVLLLLIAIIFIQNFQLRSKFRKSLNEKDNLIQKLNDQIWEIEATINHKAVAEKTATTETSNEAVQHSINDGELISDIEKRVDEEVTDEVIEKVSTEDKDDILIVENKDEQTQNNFQKSIETHIHIIENSIKKNDWQTINKNVRSLDVLLNDAGTTEFENLFKQFYSLDGQTSHRTWFETTIMLCNTLSGKIKNEEPIKN